MSDAMFVEELTHVFFASLNANQVTYRLLSRAAKIHANRAKQYETMPIARNLDI